MKFENKLIFLVVIIGLAINGCSTEWPTATGVSGTSFSGYTIGVSATHGDAALLADGSSQATIKVEVWDSSAKTVDNASVTLTVTLGTLASSSLTTTDGVAVTTFTAGGVAGNASVTATVENVSATAAITLVRF